MLLSISAIFSPKRSQFQNHWRCFYRQRTEWPDRCVVWMRSKQILSYICLCMQRTPDIALICLRSCRPLLRPTCTCMSPRYQQDYYWWRQSPSHFATSENGRTLSIVPADWQRNEREKWFVRRRAVYIRLYHEEIILHGHGPGLGCLSR